MPSADAEGTIAPTDPLPNRSVAHGDDRSDVHALIDALPTFVGMLDGSGNVTYVNASALDAAGVTLADIAGLPFWRTPWWGPTAAADVRQATARCAAGEMCSLDVEFRATPTMAITVDLQLTPMFDRSGDVRAMVPFVADVAERTKTHRDLAKAAELQAVARLRTEQMFQLARALTGATDIATILQQTSRIGRDLVGAAFANIGVVDPETNEIELLHGEGLDPEIGQRWPRVALDRTTPIGSALLSGGRVELGRQEEIAARFPSGAGDAITAGFHALAAYPIRHGRAAMGFAWTHPMDFDDELRHTLATVVDLVDLGLDRAEAGERDHRVAEQLQRSMLPLSLPDVPGASLGVLYEAGTRGMEVGGDWYDTVATPHGRYLVGLGDVVGHGLEAAAAMGQIRTAFAALGPTVSLEDLVERLSKFAVNVRGARFSTMAITEYNPDNGEVRVVSAGHVPSLIRRNDAAVEQLPDGGPPLGVDVGSSRGVVERTLMPGDTLLMYTDGLIERRGESIDVGLARLAAALNSTSAISGQLVAQALFDSLGRPRADDVAVIALVRCSV